ncbi:flagellar hook-basal body complex protein FliE [Butyrivibrio sp.]|uniref:flagellar hook-basal body complex protein FliE n=1 Tax=Butyrivibrio sp. TaxID=28121 RepID=UPI001B3DF75E|nr:flagellar hook-basal body complex protein FliE [Butyrivibrio sp.]MBP3817937.1 flagellar hook-basal body complex protein FliE [Butyrivibrio sp.]MBQ9305688.1 flagellar hook-basal body complex protein FliE [Butyrivibrio sp.]
MASLDISQLRNVTSGAVKNAEKLNSRVYNVLGDDDKGNEQAFSIIFDRAVENIHTTNAYLSDAENEEIKWSLGQTDNTHDLSIALQKAQTALQYTVAVRDRVLSAYREITQMQI